MNNGTRESPPENLVTQFSALARAGARSRAVASAYSWSQRLHRLSQLAVRTLSGLSSATLAALLPLEVLLILHSFHAHIQHRRSLILHAGTTGESSSAKGDWILQEHELSPALGVHVGFVLASAACAIFGSACLALRVCCCCWRRRRRRRKAQLPSLQHPAENAPDADAPPSNPDHLPSPQCEIRVTIEPAPDEQEQEHEIDPSCSAQQQLPRDPNTQLSGTALDANTELAPSGSEPDARETRTTPNTSEGSQPSFTFAVRSLDALMLWAAVYIIEVSSLTLEMDAALRNMPHSTELHPSALKLISSLIFEPPESASVKMKDGLSQSLVSTIVHAFGRTLGSTALVIASAALMQRLVFPTILLSTSHNEHKATVKIKTRPAREKPVKWCSMLTCAAFAAAALTLVAIDLDIIDPTGSKTIPANIDEYLDAEVSTPTVRHRRGRETVPKIDRDWREADPSGLGVVNGLSLLPNDVLDSDPTGSRATNLLSPALRNTHAVEQQNQFHMWAFTSASQLKYLSTSGPIASVIESSQITVAKRGDVYTSSYPLIQSVFPSPLQAPSAQSTFADSKPSIAALLCVLVSHLVLVSSLFVLALLTRSRTPSGDPPSDSKWQPKSAPSPTSTRSSILLSTAFVVQLTGFLALRTAGIVLNASASKRAPKTLLWSGSFGPNDKLALAVAIAWLALCVARVVGRCCTRTRQVDALEFSERPTAEATSSDTGEGTLALQNPERSSSPPPPSHSSQPAAGGSSASVALPVQASSQTAEASIRVQDTLIDGRRCEAQRARGVWQWVLGFWRQSSSGVGMASRDGRFRRGEAIDDVDLNQEAETPAVSSPQPPQSSNREPKSNVGDEQKTIVKTTKLSQPTTDLKPSSFEDKGAERVEQSAVTISCVKNAVACSSQSNPSKPIKQKKSIKASTLREDTLVEGKPSTDKVTKANKQENSSNATFKSETLPNKVEPINTKQSEDEKGNSKALKCKGGPAVSSTKLAVAVGESTEKNVQKNVSKEATASSNRGKKQKGKRELARPAALEHKSGTQLQAGSLNASDREQSRRELVRPENKQDSSAVQTRNTQGSVSSVAATGTRTEAQAAQPQHQGDARQPAPAHAKRNATGAQESSTVEAQGKRNSGHTLDKSASATTRASGQTDAGAAATAGTGGGPLPSETQSQAEAKHYIKHSDSTHGVVTHAETAARSDKFTHSDSSHSLRGRHAEIGGAAATAIVRHREKEERQKGKNREERGKDGGSGSGPLAITDSSQSRSSRSGTSNNAAAAGEGESGKGRRAGLMSEQKRSSHEEATLRSQESNDSSNSDECSEDVFAALPVPNPHKHPCAYPKSHFKSLEREREHTAKRLAALNAAPPMIVAPLPPYVPRRKSKGKKRRLQRGDGLDEEDEEEDEDEDDATSVEEDERAVRPTDLAVPKMVVEHEDIMTGWRRRKLVGPLRQKEELLGHVAEKLSKHPADCAHSPNFSRSRSVELESPTRRAGLLSPHSGLCQTPNGTGTATTHPEYSAMTLPFESPQTLELIAASERLDVSIRQTQSLGHLSALLSRPRTLDDYLREARLEAHSDVGPRSHLAHLHVDLQHLESGEQEQPGAPARLYIHRSLVNWYRYQQPDGRFALHPCNSGPIRIDGDALSLHPDEEAAAPPNTQLVLFDSL